MKSEPGIDHGLRDNPAWPQIFLKQGECYISDGNPAQVRTILGSCVTVTMYCPVLNIGGITHSLLPFPLPGTGDRRPPAPGHLGRYVDSSVNYIFAEMLSRGVSRHRLEVKIFGGGQMFLPVPGKATHEKLNIGRRNVETALKVVQNLGLQIIATDVGGNLGRKLLFFPHRGDVWVKKIKRSLGQTEVDDIANTPGRSRP